MFLLRDQNLFHRTAGTNHNQRLEGNCGLRPIGLPDSTYSEHVVRHIPKRADDVDIERELRFRHDVIDSLWMGE